MSISSRDRLLSFLSWTRMVGWHDVFKSVPVSYTVTTLTWAPLKGKKYVQDCYIVASHLPCRLLIQLFAVLLFLFGIGPLASDPGQVSSFTHWKPCTLLITKFNKTYADSVLVSALKQLAQLSSWKCGRPLVFQYHQRQNKACSVSQWQPGKGNQKISSHSLPIFIHLMACAETLRHMKSKQHSELGLVLLQDKEITLRVASKCAAQPLGLQLKFPSKFLDEPYMLVLSYRSIDLDCVSKMNT